LARGAATGVVVSLFFDALKLCHLHVMSEAAFGRMWSVLHDSWTYVHVLHALCTEMCILLRRCACVSRQIARCAKMLDLLVYAAI
jgi:hypothetical protein